MVTVVSVLFEWSLSHASIHTDGPTAVPSLLHKDVGTKCFYHYCLDDTMSSILWSVPLHRFTWVIRQQAMCYKPNHEQFAELVWKRTVLIVWVKMLGCFYQVVLKNGVKWQYARLCIFITYWYIGNVVYRSGLQMCNIQFISGLFCFICIINCCCKLFVRIPFML